MNVETSYYAIEPLEGGPASVLFRRRGSGIPERYVPGPGWIEDSWLMVWQAGGDPELTDVTSGEAQEIAGNLDASKPAIFYYAIDSTDGEPEALLRFYKHHAKPGECYVPLSGWTKDKGLWRPELAGRDVRLKDVTEQQALDIMRSLDRGSKPG